MYYVDLSYDTDKCRVWSLDTFSIETSYEGVYDSPEHLPDEIKNRVLALSIMQPKSSPVSGVGMRSAVDKFWVYI